MTTPPDVHTSAKKYEYIFNDYETYAGMFDYPKRVSQVGWIYDAGGQGCTNVLYGYGRRSLRGMRAIFDANIARISPFAGYSVTESAMLSTAYMF